jgi:hypothetical protein
MIIFSCSVLFIYIKYSNKKMVAKDEKWYKILTNNNCDNTEFIFILIFIEICLSHKNDLNINQSYKTYLRIIANLY